MVEEFCYCLNDGKRIVLASGRAASAIGVMGKDGFDGWPKQQDNWSSALFLFGEIAVRRALISNLPGHLVK